MATFDEIVEQINNSIKSQLDSCELNLEIKADARANLGADLYQHYKFIFNSELSELIKIVAVKIRIMEELLYENDVSTIPDHLIQFHLKWEIKC